MQDQVLLNNCLVLDSMPAANIQPYLTALCQLCTLFTPVKMPVT